MNNACVVTHDHEGVSDGDAAVDGRARGPASASCLSPRGTRREPLWSPMYTVPISSTGDRDPPNP